MPFATNDESIAIILNYNKFMNIKYFDFDFSDRRLNEVLHV